MMTVEHPEDQTNGHPATQTEAWATNTGPWDRDRSHLDTAQLRVVRTRSELSDALTDATMYAPGLGRRAVVMTMGALHQGHLALVRAAREACDHLTVTIFVNPLQFGQGEDLDKYPRNLEADLALLEHEGVDLVFAPSVETMFPKGKPEVTVRAGRLGTVLEGAARPGHFDGVLTIVAKLLHLTRPEMAFFGQKDAQQLAVIRRMVRDLEFTTEVRTVPIIRDEDGLALSSRNSYLAPAQRELALSLSKALRAAEQAKDGGATAVREAARMVLDRQPIDMDYQVLVDPETLEEVPATFAGQALMLLAGRVGEIRLLDNMELDISCPQDVMDPTSSVESEDQTSTKVQQAEPVRAEYSRPDISELAAAVAALNARSTQAQVHQEAEERPFVTAEEDPPLVEEKPISLVEQPASVVDPAIDDGAGADFADEDLDREGLVSTRDTPRVPLKAVDPAWVAPTRIAPANLGGAAMGRARGTISRDSLGDGDAKGPHDLPPPTLPVEVS